MANQQNLLPHYWFLYFLFFKIGVSTAQNRIPITIQNDASGYAILLFNHYFKSHEATWDSCGLFFDTKEPKDDCHCNGIGLFCTFSLVERDSFTLIVENCRTNRSISQKYHYNITNESSNEPLFRKWNDDLLALLLQIDTSLIAKVQDFNAMLPLLKNREPLLTHDNLLKNNKLCDLLADSIKIALQDLATYNDQPHWKNLFLDICENLEIKFETPNALKTLRYLPNIKHIVLDGNWKTLKNVDIISIRNAGVSVTVSKNRDSKLERERYRTLLNTLEINGIETR